ncbi:hypothetical protein K438DRAFT_1823989 [Mycena galopus ATCC 62051]|nr:hypothetical protein K438DRAFT_1823989 [Mycena galopus ATCC 62051]
MSPRSGYGPSHLPSVTHPIARGFAGNVPVIGATNLSLEILDLGRSARYFIQTTEVRGQIVCSVCLPETSWSRVRYFGSGREPYVVYLFEYSPELPAANEGQVGDDFVGPILIFIFDGLKIDFLANSVNRFPSPAIRPLHLTGETSLPFYSGLTASENYAYTSQSVSNWFGR